MNRSLAAVATLATFATLAPRIAAAQLNSPSPSGVKAEQVVPVAGAQYGAPERFAAILGFAVANGGMGSREPATP